MSQLLARNVRGMGPSNRSGPLSARLTRPRFMVAIRSRSA
jgi:hypothetical protein